MCSNTNKTKLLALCACIIVWHVFKVEKFQILHFFVDKVKNNKNLKTPYVNYHRNSDALCNGNYKTPQTVRSSEFVESKYQLKLP